MEITSITQSYHKPTPSQLVVPCLYLFYSYTTLNYFPQFSLLMPLSYENYFFLINGLHFLTIYFTIVLLSHLTEYILFKLFLWTSRHTSGQLSKQLLVQLAEQPSKQPRIMAEEEAEEEAEEAEEGEGEAEEAEEEGEGEVEEEAEAGGEREGEGNYSYSRDIINTNSFSKINSDSSNTSSPNISRTPSPISGENLSLRKMPSGICMKHTEMLRNIVQDQTILNKFMVPNDPNPPPMGILTIVFDNELYKDAILRCRTPKGFRLHTMLKEYYGKPSPQSWHIVLDSNRITAVVQDSETPLKMTLIYPKPPNDSQEFSMQE